MMRAYTEYWVAIMLRGFLAVIAGSAILVLPAMISDILLRPFAITLSVLCLALYGTVDSAIVLMTSFMAPHHVAGRLALQVQGLTGAVLGALLFSLLYQHADLKWFVYLAAFQAASAAFAELIVARGTAAHYSSVWCYVSAVIAITFALGLLLGRELGPRDLAWLLYAYLGAFGFNLCALSARMLFTERHSLRLPFLKHDALVNVA